MFELGLHLGPLGCARGGVGQILRLVVGLGRGAGQAVDRVGDGDAVKGHGAQQPARLGRAQAVDARDAPVVGLDLVQHGRGGRLAAQHIGRQPRVRTHECARGAAEVQQIVAQPLWLR
ncbi:hypothetical protein CK623_04060 [Vandammella animalimorsus]|uniref:Uncharacterized protein n=1 Tax=Vandammella animalimorsus TaxID=2029117 RepID=A0A2A2AKS1_9BURK|nr:hypothetical protein [Vandammella animalimorsus]PAT38324.1 hypothetical protein CK625_02200 [Vandammella animalimorsus]PAT40947.1 hypothetical protein CK623_04060 [Vandammella animalimorsus]